MMRKLLFALCLIPRLVLAVCTVTDSYSSVICADGPSNYWRMDASSGSTETDISGSANLRNLTYNGGFSLNQTGIACCADKAASFNGSTGYIDSAGNGMPVFPDPTVGVNYSAEQWVQTSSASVQELFDLSGASTAARNYDLALSGTQAIVLATFDNCNTNNVNVATSAGVFVTGTSYHQIVITAAGAGSGQIAWKIYYDSSLVKSQTVGTSLCGTSEPVTLGRRAAGLNDRFFSGKIDEVSLYGTNVLSQAQVTAHYVAGLAVTSGWPFTVKRPELPRFMDEGYFAEAAARGYHTGHFTFREIQPQLLNVGYPNFAVMPWGNVGR